MKDNPPLPSVRKSLNVVRMLLILVFIFIYPNPISGKAKSSAQTAAVYFVAVQASGANNGSSWTDAFQDLHPALEAAAAGDQVWVAEGIYRVSKDAMGFRLKDGVQVLGGFRFGTADPLQRDWSRYPTILSGDRAGNDGTLPDANQLIDNSPTVIYASGVGSETLLDGFILQGGYGGVSTPSCLQGCGGGISLVGSSPFLGHLTISGNYAFDAGGGLYAEDSSPLLVNTAFIANQSQEGGGIYVSSGQVVLAYTSLQGNQAAHGAGIFLAEAGKIEMENSLVWGNLGSPLAAEIAITLGAEANLHYSIPGVECPTNAVCEEGVRFHDPLFLDVNGNDQLPGTLDDDLRLAAYSPAVNAGQPVLLPVPDRDLACQPRLVEAVDIGAFEHPQPNHAPVLLDQPVTLDGMNWIGKISQGVLVSDFLQEIAFDQDRDSVGIAVTTAEENVGQWQFLLPASAATLPANSATSTPQWTSVRNVNAASAILLTPDTRLRFVPEDGVSGTAVLSMRAWDGSDQLNPVTDRANTLLNGNANAYSETETVLTGRNYPTYVPVYGFDAQAVEDGISLTWQTATEINTLGFYLSRQSAREDQMTQITSAMIEAQSPGSLMGEDYEWMDPTADPDLEYVYLLEVVQQDGSILLMDASYVPLGPVQWRVLLPCITR